MTSTSISSEPPRGMRDFYPDDMAVRNRIFEAWRTAARQFGFQEYDACVVESLALLKRKAGEEIEEQIYTFKDKSGRDLALRPEITPSLARLITARQGSLAFPLKWFAVAQCFRYERTSLGRKREHYQWNLDIVGENSLTAEAEVLACAFRALDMLGLPANAVQLRYNNRALLSELLAKAGLAKELHQAVFLILDKRGKINDAAMTELLREHGLDAGAIDAVFEIAAINSLEQAETYLNETSSAIQTLRDFKRLMGVHGLADRIRFDLGVIRGLGYYTGLVFEAFDAARSFRAIFGGGRYDRLLQDLGGKSMPSVGLGFGDVVIAELLDANGRLPRQQPALDLAVGFMAAEQQDLAIALAQAERGRGRQVDCALHPEKPKHFFARVGNGLAREAVYLGPDDLARGTARVKDLNTREEREIELRGLFVTNTDI